MTAPATLFTDFLIASFASPAAFWTLPLISCAAPLVATDRNRLRSRSLALPIASFATPDAPSRARIVPLPVQLLASRLARREQNYWINDLGWIERLVLTLKDAADCQKMFAPWGAALERRCVGNFPWTGGARG